MNMLKPVAFEALMVALAAAGWMWDMAAARWVLYGLLWWLLLPCALVCAFNTQVQMLSAEWAPHGWPVQLANRLAWLAVLAVLLWHGAWVSAAAVAVCVVCGFIYSGAVRQIRAA